MRYRYREPHEMKDSGVEWLVKIPKEWEVSKLKNIAHINMGQSPESISVNYNNEGLPFFQGKSEFGKIYPIPKVYCNEPKKIAYQNELLISVRAPVGNLNIVNHKCCIGRGLASIKADHSKKFLYYSLVFSKLQLQSYATGSTFEAVSVEQLKNIKISCPSQNDQKKIADFLDQKTAEFDAIVEKKHSFIAKLEEVKKSLISEVVTGKKRVLRDEGGELRAENRSADEMKYSGVEWLGMIPKEWELKKIKFLYEIRNERNKKAMNEVEILSLYTSLGVKRQDEIEYKTGNKVRTVEDYKIVYPDDIVVNIILAWMGSIGMSKHSGVISPAYDIYKPLKNVLSKYYNYLFRTSKFSGECFKYGRGIMLMRWRTYSDEFKSIISCQPPLKEQEMIADFLEQKTTNIDSTIEKIKLQIEKLKEAKQSLISEAVTGKIEVLD